MRYTYTSNFADIHAGLNGHLTTDGRRLPLSCSPRHFCGICALCWALRQVETAGALAHVGAALVLQPSSLSASEVTTALKDELLPHNSTYVINGGHFSKPS